MGSKSSEIQRTYCELKELDSCEVYILYRVCRFTCRALGRLRTLTRDTVDLLLWILGEDIHAFGEYIEKSLENEKDQKEFSKKLAICRVDPEDYPHVLNVFQSRIQSHDQKKLMKFCLELLKKREKALEKLVSHRSEVERGLDQISKAFSLSEVESDLYFFLFVVESWDVARTFFYNYLGCNVYSGRKQLAQILGCRRSDIARTTKGTLFQAGILSTNTWGELELSSTFLDALGDPDQGFSIKNLYQQAPHESLELEAHHVEPDVLNHLVGLLENRPVKNSTHILLYGPPGTGKTSFARALAQKIDAMAYEIPAQQDNEMSARRAGLIACLHLENEGKGNLVIIDEADNLLNTEMSWFVYGEAQDKGWLNSFLDEKGTRILWITNQINRIDPSVMRRFSMSLQFRPLDREQRILLWERILRRRKIKRFFSGDDIRQFAAQHRSNAGIVDLAVAQAAQAKVRTKKQARKAISLSLKASETLLARGQEPSKKDDFFSDRCFSLEGLNTNQDLDQIVNKLRAFDRYIRREKNSSTGTMSLLFFGPPGCGKSELGRYIAHELDRELMVRRASDILDPYVGMTERRIAAAFDEAQREDAVLMIDEIDTMLFSRENAVRSWEVSSTNEFLTQIERFRGILIGTTNRAQALDQASIRRFNFKIGFDHLTPEGNEIFYERLLASLVRGQISQKDSRTLRDFRGLCPGDFKVVRDQFFFESKENLTHQALITALGREVELKRQGTAKIGF